MNIPLSLSNSLYLKLFKALSKIKWPNKILIYNIFPLIKIKINILEIQLIKTKKSKKF